MGRATKRIISIALVFVVAVGFIWATQRFPLEEVRAAALPVKPVPRVLPRADAEGDTRLACLGDSNADFTCSLNSNSVISHALLRKNRRWFFEPNGGADQGSNFAASGSSTGTMGCPGQMNCPARLAAVAAYNPDVLFIWVGRNENSSGSIATVENIKAAVDTILADQPTKRLRAVIVLPVVPGSEHNFVPRPLDAAQWSSNRQMRQALIDLARADPLYHVFDVAARFTDPKAAPMPIGGLDGGPGAVMLDGIHPSQVGARLVADEFNQLLDSIGVKAAEPLRLGGKVAKDAAPAVNLVGSTNGISNGRFLLGGGGVGTGGSGEAPAGFRVTSDGPELLWNGAVKRAFPDKGGAERVGFQLSISAKAPLASDKGVVIEAILPQQTLQKGHLYTASLHARIATSTRDACAGLTNIALAMSFPLQNGRWLTYGQDIRHPNAATPSDLLDIAASEDRDYQIPVIMMREAPASAIHLLIVPQFKVGTMPSACTIFLSDLALRQIG